MGDRSYQQLGLINLQAQSPEIGFDHEMRVKKGQIEVKNGKNQQKVSRNLHSPVS